MKKYIFILVSMISANYMTAQGIDKNGKIVTDATFSTLKVGAIISTSKDGTGQALTDLDSGKIIYLSGNASGMFASSPLLSDGFTATFINTNQESYISVSLPSPLAIFFGTGMTNAFQFSIPPGGIVKLYVITVGESKRYYLLLPSTPT